MLFLDEGTFQKGVSEKGMRSIFQGEADTLDFRKAIYENVKKRIIHFTTNISIYIGHRHFEVL